MPVVKCLECDLTISYPCDATTVLLGITTIADKEKEQQIISEKKVNRVLTLECHAGHRHNYLGLCQE